MSLPHTITAAVIISDCIDENARVRQQCRFASLFGVEPSYVGVSSSQPELEAAGHLVDVLDAHRFITPSTSGCSTPLMAPIQDPMVQGNHHACTLSNNMQPMTAVIIVNVAPRTESIKKKWDNGTPFCYFVIGSVLIVSTYSIPILSLLFRILNKENNYMGCNDSSKIHIMDTSQVIKHASEKQWLPDDDACRIINTQFRSYEFVPLVAHWIATRGGPNALPHRLLNSLNDEDEQDVCDSFVWFIDNFGNCKTSLLPDDANFEENRQYTVELQSTGETLDIRSFKRLADAIPGSPCLVIGSSGFKNFRFLELVIKNCNFSVKTGTGIGPIKITRND